VIQQGVELRRLVAMHAEEVGPMLDRLATVNDADRMLQASEEILASGARFKFASELEQVLLAKLGHRTDVLHGDARRARRARGLACPQCYDSGWIVDDQLMATRCDCAPPLAERDTEPELPRHQQRASEETAYGALTAMRQTLHRTEPEVHHQPEPEPWPDETER
jgi:hypothetical protein